MRGHKKGVCAKDNTKETVAPEDELAKSMRLMQLDVSEEKDERKGRRRSSIKRQPSLESLSDSSSDILTGLATPPKKAIVKKGETEHAPAISLPIMPGSLVKPEPSDRMPDRGLFTPEQTPDRIPNDPKKPRKTVRVSLPGPTRSSLRLQRARSLDPSDTEESLRAIFFKSTSYQATLFKMASKDCEATEKAAEKLGLQSHYYLRGNTDKGDDESRQAFDLLIVGKNDKAIDEMLRTMQDEVKTQSTKEPNKQAVSKYFLAQVTAVGIGAAAMWAGLAFY